MNRTVRALRNGMGLLALLALAATAMWLIVQSRPRSAQLAQTSPLPTPTADHFRSPLPSPSAPAPTPSPSPTPRKPDPSPQPTAAPTHVGQRVPFCTFPGGDPPDKGGPGLDKYEFSEPLVVLTGTVGIDIAGWLPDGRQLLITRRMPQSNRERIETLDMLNGKMQFYAERDQHNGKPIWLSAIQGVAYSSAFSTARSGQFALYTSQGEPSETVTVVTSESNGAALGVSLAVEPGGSRLSYLVNRTGGRLQSWDAMARVNQATPFDITEWGSSFTPGEQYIAHPFWSPNGTRLAIFTFSTLFLVEPGPNRVCEVSVQGWPLGLYSQWSPNSRYLAVIIANEQPDPLVRSTDLLILDGLTGKQRKLAFRADQGSVTDVSWGPDSRHLIALVRTPGTHREERPIEKLLLVDTITGDMRLILPERPFGGGRDGERLAWSPNGQHLALKCPLILDFEPTLVEDRICLISTAIRP